MNTPRYLLVFILLSLLSSCNSNPSHLFQLISPAASGIHFSNTITENDSINILKNEYVYNGGGVGIGDFNNDGLQDIYFTGNMVSNQLYLNQGNLKFKEVTAIAGVEGEGRWCSGVAVVDINNDGWLDLYVSTTMRKDSINRTNLLFINNGLDGNGIPVFTERASEYGIANTGYSTMAAFFDYDKDGDLDLYLLDHEKPTTTYREKITDGTGLNNDHLYRNNGNGSFTDVTKAAGILLEGFGLGLAITDFNLDGWPDIYVANDYLTNDLLWINNQDGTFTNRISDYLKHQSYSSMGTDVTDINNDGFVDILTLEMLPEDNKRKKMMRRANNYTTYLNNRKYGYEFQYIRNTLQLNSGISPKGHPVFSEIGMLSGIYQTDWSWAPLVADFDNDGFRDIIITNGFPKDVTDQDFAAYRSGPAGAVSGDDYLLDFIPSVKISNYAFKNNRDLTFKDVTKEWGIEVPSYSNGAAYADLDNDGDLDFVVNNIEDEAFLYENNLYDNHSQLDTTHFLRIKFEGEGENKQGIGAKVMVNYGDGKKQFYEHSLFRGYLSTVENAAHFGLGTYNRIDSLQIYWPDGKYQLFVDLPADQSLLVKQRDAQQIPLQRLNKEIHLLHGQALFQEVSRHLNLVYKHEEEEKVDFNMQVTIPHKFTRNGPGIAVGDVDENGYDDFYIAGAAGEKGQFFLQDPQGKFNLASGQVKGYGQAGEDIGVLLFDADNDKDLDLYVVSGSYEFAPGAKEHRDRLYTNNGEGKFEADTTALPETFANGSVVIAADYDKDRDLDLFVGGNVMPGQYPYPDQSVILRNDNGRFSDVTEEIAPGLKNIGIINDALWTDFDNDGYIDLLLAGEWMPLTFFKNNKGAFENVTHKTGINENVGWWKSLASGDFDHDGDMDYLAGNLGLNTRYKGKKGQPLSVYAKDFDGNGTVDPILTTYLKAEDGTLKPFPMHGKDDLTFLIPRMKKKFPQYAPYAMATINEILTPEDKNGALMLHANHLESSCLENKGEGKFEISALPVKAQFAPIFGMLVQDFNGDGNLDALLVGNSYGTEIFTGRYDAFTGLYLKGNGEGDFEPSGMNNGFFVEGDAKGIVHLQGSSGEQIILVTQNQDSIKAFVNTMGKSGSQGLGIRLNPWDSWAEVELKGGQKYKKEFYYGSAYLSQSSRVLWVTDQVKRVNIYDFNGLKREVVPEPRLMSQKTF